MFGLFRPTCPCDPAAKRWIEDKLNWLSKQFGLHILLERSVILPTVEFFPDQHNGSEECVHRLFDRVCEFMEVGHDSVELEIFDDTVGFGMASIDPTRGIAGGTWQMSYDSGRKGRIRIERGGMECFSDLVGTMAHELAHQRLLGEGRYRHGAFDNELLTDLTAIYFGFGVFLANNPRKSTGKLGKWPGTDLHRPEYISEPMLGYALAHIAWFRNEDRSDWAKYLRWAQRGVFNQGLRFLQKTGDSTFKPVWLRSKG